MTILVDDPEIQRVFDALYWSGKTIIPRCAIQTQNCVIDYVFPIDANLGVNKANFFVSRLLTQRVNIGEDGKIVSNLFVQLQPRQSTELKISYELPRQIKSGRSVYQLIFQKQIGSNNSDFILEITLPKNISLSNQNFSALVKDNRIFYNTSLTADKIFFLELLK